MAKSSIKFEIKPNAVKNAISNSTIKYNCPECNNELEFLAKQIGSSITCSQCGVKINLKDDNFSTEVNKLQQTFDKIFK